MLNAVGAVAPRGELNMRAEHLKRVTRADSMTRNPPCTACVYPLTIPPVERLLLPVEQPTLPRSGLIQ